MEQLKSMKECLISQAQAQMGNLQNVEAKELGEVIDMIKDLDEAIYYCTIVEAMNENKEEEKYKSKMQMQSPMYYGGNSMMYPPMEYEYGMDRNMGKMYYGGNNGSNSNGNGSTGRGSTSYYQEQYNPYQMNSMYPMHDYREGRSHMSRRNYMESKELHQGKEVQLKELEKYMQELTRDITDMIEDASPEEKQMLQQKINTLATKIK